jgi:hypothetical protein
MVHQDKSKTALGMLSALNSEVDQSVSSGSDWIRDMSNEDLKGLTLVVTNIEMIRLLDDEQLQCVSQLAIIGLTRVLTSFQEQDET